MNDELRKCDGVITVFLAMAFICIVTLIFTLVESARTAGLRFYQQLACDSAIDSLFSEYDPDLWRNYRLVLLYCHDMKNAEIKMAGYMQPYLKADNWMAMDMSDSGVSIEEYDRITDYGGQWLEQQVLDYMQFGVINSLFDTEDKAKNLWADLKEAKSMQSITDSYSEYSGEAVELENAISDIADSLKRQRTLKEKAEKALSRGDASEFESAAGALEREIEKIPDMVCRYETKADELAGYLQSVDEKHQADFENLSDESGEIIADMKESYGDYINADGIRRNEIEEICADTDRNIDIVRHAVDLADEIEALIDEMEDDEKSDYGDEISQLWNELGAYFDNIRIGEIKSEFGMADSNKENILERAKSILGGNFLDLVIPDGRTVSDALVNLNDAPSMGICRIRDMGRRSKVDDIVINEYIEKYFAGFTDYSSDSYPDNKASYEIEYICEGHGSDRENLKSVIADIFVIREGMNYLHIMRDSEKRNEVHELSSLIVGSVGMPALTPLISSLIIGVWAGAESLIDIKTLLSGNKVSLVKDSSEWKLDLDSIFTFGETGKVTGDCAGSDKGLDYEEYLKFIILLIKSEKRNYRMLDIIQANMRLKKENYLAEDLVYAMKISATCNAEHIFAPLLPQAVLTTSTQKAY